MRVALVFPRRRYPSGDVPLGIAYLAACLQPLLDEPPFLFDMTFVRNGFRELEKILSARRFDLVGVSCMLTMADDAMQVARIVKRHNPRAWVVIGGPHPTTCPERVLNEPAVDAVCLGEGEFALMEIIKRQTLTGIPGIAVRHHRHGITQEPPVFIDDLDTLPFPAVELLPMRQYLHHFLQFDTIAPGVKGMAILSSRGCPFSCSYCQPVLTKLFGERIRRRSPGNVVDEMELRQKQLGVSGFMFADDTFGTQRLWVEQFCEEIRNRQLNVIWGCDLRADRVDPQLLQTMWTAGLRKIAIGIEVYDDAYRADVLNKPISREQIESAVTAARRLPISVQGYFMIGGPGETRSSIRRTIQYAKSLPIHDATFSITTPLPGTLLEAKFRDKVTLEPEKFDYYRHYAFETTPELESRWLKRRLMWAYTSFYGRQRRLAKQARLLATRGGISRFWTKLRRVIS